MVIQYGYLTMFAAAFPLAPVLAVVNNMVEIRTDAFKLLTSFGRPEYRGAASIGSWYNILEIVGVIAVVTNCLILGFTLNSIADIYGAKNSLGRYAPIDAFRTFATIVVIEHLLLLLKYFISFAVPDVPGWIGKELGRQEFIKEQTLNKRQEEEEVKVWKDTLKFSDDEWSDDEGEKEERKSKKKDKKEKKEKKEKEKSKEEAPTELTV